MRRNLVMFITGLLLSPLDAVAQPAPHEQPITLSAEEYNAILNALAQRDPIIAALMRKQTQAQQAAAKPPATAASPADGVKPN